MSVVGRILPPLQRCPLPSGYVILHDKKDFVFIIEIDWLNQRLSQIIWADPISCVLKDNKQKSRLESKHEED